MNLLKIILFCVVGTNAFSTEETADKVDEKPITSTTVTVWVGNPQADALITKGIDTLNALIEEKPQLKSVSTKIAPYLSSVHTFTENADQKMFLAFIAGSVLSQNEYLYLITLPASAYYAERSLKSIADAWRISGEEKKAIMTIKGASFDARELFITAGAIATLWKCDVYSATFLAVAYGAANFTRDNKEKLFDAGSFFAYMILLNALDNLNI
jgi:hypothetical protein